MLNRETVEDLVSEARCEALDTTECYQDRVFDWREEDAGRWADEFPNRGVVLGIADRELFLKLLEEWKDKPFQAALESLKWSKGRNWGWRTQKELRQDGAAVYPNPHNGKDERHWSAVPVRNTELVLDEEMLRALWDDDGFWSYNVKTIVALAAGDYLPDSCFYSVPDYSAKISSEIFQEAKEHPERFALVFLDYHY